jgi:hypothetical protein
MELDNAFEIALGGLAIDLVGKRGDLRVWEK